MNASASFPLIAPLALALAFLGCWAGPGQAGQVQGPGSQAPRSMVWGAFLQGLSKTPQGQALAVELKVDPNDLDPALIAILDQQKSLSPQQLDLKPGEAAPKLAADQVERVGKALDAYALAATVEAKAALESGDSGKIAVAQAKLLLLSRIQGRLGEDARKAVGRAQENYRSAMSAEVHASLQDMVSGFLREGRNVGELFEELGQWRRDLSPTMAAIPAEGSDPRKAALWAEHSLVRSRPGPGTDGKSEPPSPLGGSPWPLADLQRRITETKAQDRDQTAVNLLKKAIALLLASSLGADAGLAQLRAFLESLLLLPNKDGAPILKNLQAWNGELYFIDSQNAAYRYVMGQAEPEEIGKAAPAPEMTPGFSDLPAGLWQAMPLAKGQVIELKLGSSDMEMASVALGRDEKGAVSARLVNTNGTVLEELPLKPGAEATIGRAQENRIQVPDRRVSASHARLIVFAGEVWVKDELSRNGTSATKALDALAAADRLFEEIAAARAGRGLMDSPEREAALNRIRRLLRLFGEAARPAAFKRFVGRLMQAGYFAFHNAYFDGTELFTNHLETRLSRYAAKDSVLDELRWRSAQGLTELGLRIAAALKTARSDLRNALEAQHLKEAAKLLAKNRALLPQQRVRMLKDFILNLHGQGFRAGRLRMLGEALLYAHSKEGFYYNGVDGEGPQLPRGSGAEAALDLYFEDLAFKAKQGQEISGDDKRDVQQVARAVVGLYYPAAPQARQSALSGFYAKLGQAGYFRRDSIEIGPRGLYYTGSNGRVAVYDAQSNAFVDAPKPQPEEFIVSQIQAQLFGWFSPRPSREPLGRVVNSVKNEHALILWVNTESGRVLGMEKEFVDNPFAAPVEATYDKNTGKVRNSLFNKKGEVVDSMRRQFLGSDRGLSFQAQSNLAEAIARHNQRP